MKRTILLSLLCGILLAATAQAQFVYDFSAKQSVYTPLMGATSLNGTNVWDSESYKIPIGFNFKMNGVQLDSCNLSFFQMMGDDTMSNLTASTPSNLFSGFLFMNADLHDRADTGTAVLNSVSPISYKVEGLAPDRIFKLEFYNAGFVTEYDTYGTNEDSLNLQIWLYEKNNEIEFHFGPSKVTYITDYFYMQDQVPFVYFDELNTTNSNIKKFYYLYGDPLNPNIDSSSNPNDLIGLDGYPLNGTVYKFAPKMPASIQQVNKQDINVYPTTAEDRLFVSNAENTTLRYTVVSVNGAITHLSGKIEANTTTELDVSELANGSYIVQIAGKDGRSTIRFFKI